MHTLIITGGAIDVSFAEKYIRQQKFDLIISADSGMEFCRTAEIFPHKILGDFDSAKPETLTFFREKCPERMEVFPAEKDETDTELAILRALEAGADQITILGGTGSRMDHVLGNIHLLKMALDKGADCCLVDPHNRIRMVDRTLILKKEDQFGDYVSLIPFTPQVTGLTLTGFKYQVEDFTLLWGKARGVSNEIADAEARIDMKSGILLVIESRD